MKITDGTGQQKSTRNLIQDHKKQKIVFLELGVGYNTPGIIKYPFWKMTNTFQQAFYVCLNQGEAYAPEEIKEKSVCMKKILERS